MYQRRAQRWLDGVPKWCTHDVVDLIKNQGEQVIAEVCAHCQIRIAEYGTCAGCARERMRLVKFVLSKRKAYCSDGCYQASEQRKRDAASLARKAPKP